MRISARIDKRMVIGVFSELKKGKSKRKRKRKEEEEETSELRHSISKSINEIYG